MHILQEHFRDVCSEVIPWREFLDRNRRFDDDSTIELANRYQKLQITNGTIDNEVEDDEEDFFDAHSVVTVSLSETDDEEDYYYDARSTIGDSMENLIHEQEDTERNNEVEDHQGYNNVVRKTPKARANLYSKPCPYKFWCVKGLKCDFKHNEEQRDFFKTNPDIKYRKFYKIKSCYHKVCDYSKRSYLCPYAHDVKEARCLCCGQKDKEPHWMDQCPYNKFKK